MKTIAIQINGKNHQAQAGQTVASALAQHAQGITRCSPSGELRAPVCGMGVCQECRVSINGAPHQLACQRLCEPGMQIVNAQAEQTAPHSDAGVQKTAIIKVELAIIGAGPGGLAACLAAAKSGMQCVLIDDNPMIGGQIWRAAVPESTSQAAQDFAALQALPNVQMLLNHKVILVQAGRELLLQDNGQAASLAKSIRYQKLILATGARERLLPFPGWTLRGVTGLGGLQAQVKAGYPVEGKRVVLAGTGPLLFAVAATLRQHGAQVLFIAEQATSAQVLQFGLALWRTPNKLTQAASLMASLLGVRYKTDSYIVSASGKDGALQQVRIKQSGAEITLDCDLLACAYGLLPNTRLAQAFGCMLEQGRVKVDAQQASSVENLWCIGEATGVGGVDKARIEGHIAGLAASGQAVTHLASERQRWQAFAQQLASSFALREELKHLCEADTIVCRCEDVRWQQLQAYDDWRSAKLHTRCGMGACQGQICGAALQQLRGWQVDGQREPLALAKIGSLLGE